MLLRVIISTLTILLVLSATCANLAFSMRTTERTVKQAERYIEIANERCMNDIN